MLESISASSLILILQQRSLLLYHLDWIQVCFHSANDLNVITGIITFVDIFTDFNGFPVSIIILERVSPEVILLRPPEKLVIEVKASGRFARIDWQKNGVLITKTPEEFPSHSEIFVRELTSMADLTLYEVSLFPASPVTQIALPDELDFIVTSPGRLL